MKEVEGLWVENPSIADATTMFKHVQNDLGIPAVTPKNRKRNMSELSWKSAVNELRSLKKRARNNNIDEDDEDDDLMEMDESE